MKTDLNVPERLTALSLLPEQGSFVTLRLIRDLSEKLGLSAEELDQYDVRHEEGGVRWNDEGNTTTAFKLEPREVDLLRDALETLDAEEALQQRHYSLYEKFVSDSP